MSAVLPDSYYKDDFSPETSKFIITSEDTIDSQETERHDSSEYESPYFHDTDSEDEFEDDYLNREENTIGNVYDLHYNHEQTSSYTLSPPSDRRFRGTVHYEPLDDFGPSVFDDSEFSIPASLASFSEQSDKNVKTESDATEAASNLSGTTLASAESPLPSSQVPTESLPSSQAVLGGSSPSQDGSQHSINGWYYTCHNYGCPRQQPALLRQESSPSALMIPFKRRRNFYHPPRFSDI